MAITAKEQSDQQTALYSVVQLSYKDQLRLQCNDVLRQMLPIYIVSRTEMG